MPTTLRRSVVPNGTWRKQPHRRRMEQLETRQMMSANPVGQFQIDPTEQAAIATQTATNSAQLTGLDLARAEFGFTGKGQTVAVIDTGIAYTHNALGGGYGTGYKV